jgi:quinol monooxygenase YgiN
MVTTACAANSTTEKQSMYGLIGKMKCTPGQRDSLISILLEGVSGMPGCLSYVVAKDPADPDSLWVTEAWESQDKHKASLSLPSVQAAITKARPLIAGFGERFETQPVGGHGLVSTKSSA